MDKIKEYEPSKCISCGILVKVKKGSIGVTHSISDAEEVAEIMIIPRKAIQKIEVISTFKK